MAARSLLLALLVRVNGDAAEPRLLSLTGATAPVTGILWTPFRFLGCVRYGGSAQVTNSQSCTEVTFGVDGRLRSATDTCMKYSDPGAMGLASCATAASSGPGPIVDFRFVFDSGRLELASAAGNCAASSNDNIFKTSCSETDLGQLWLFDSEIVGSRILQASSGKCLASASSDSSKFEFVDASSGCEEWVLVNSRLHPRSDLTTCMKEQGPIIMKQTCLNEQASQFFWDSAGRLRAFVAGRCMVTDNPGNEGLLMNPPGTPGTGANCVDNDDSQVFVVEGGHLAPLKNEASAKCIGMGSGTATLAESACSLVFAMDSMGNFRVAPSALAAQSTDAKCLWVPSSTIGGEVELKACDTTSAASWFVREGFRLKSLRNGGCLAVDGSTVKTLACDPSDDMQLWVLPALPTVTTTTAVAATTTTTTTNTATTITATTISTTTTATTKTATTFTTVTMSTTVTTSVTTTSVTTTSVTTVTTVTGTVTSTATATVTRTSSVTTTSTATSMTATTLTTTGTVTTATTAATTAVTTATATATTVTATQAATVMTTLASPSPLPSAPLPSPEAAPSPSAPLPGPSPGPAATSPLPVPGPSPSLGPSSPDPVPLPAAPSPLPEPVTPGPSSQAVAPSPLPAEAPGPLPTSSVPIVTPSVAAPGPSPNASPLPNPSPSSGAPSPSSLPPPQSPSPGPLPAPLDVAPSPSMTPSASPPNVAPNPSMTPSASPPNVVPSPSMTPSSLPPNVAPSPSMAPGASPPNVAPSPSMTPSLNAGPVLLPSPSADGALSPSPRASPGQVPSSSPIEAPSTMPSMSPMGMSHDVPSGPVQSISPEPSPSAKVAPEGTSTAPSATPTATTTETTTRQQWSVYVLAELGGLSAALATSGTTAAAFTSAVEESILDVIKAKDGVVLPRSALHTVLPGGRRLQGTASSSDEVEVGVAAGTSMSASMLFEVLLRMKSELMALMRDRFAAVLGIQTEAQPKMAHLLLESVRVVFGEVPPLSSMVDAAVAATIPRLVNGRHGRAGRETMTLEDGGTLTVARVDRILEDSLDNRTYISFPGMQVSLPTRELRAPALLPPGQQLLLAVATPGSLGAASGHVVWASASISFHGPDGSYLPLKALTEPVEFSLPVDYTEGLACEFWDEDALQWSAEGMALSNKTVSGESVWCAAGHLTVFGAVFRGFVDAVLCSQLGLFSVDAMAELLDPAWLKGPGSIFYACFLAAALLAMAAACKADRRQRSPRWSMEELFLIPTKAQEPEAAAKQVPAEEQGNKTLEDQGAKTRDAEDPPRAEEGANQRNCCTRLGLSVAACTGSMCAWFRENAIRDAVDEIMSEYFEQFGESRELLEELCAECSPTALLSLLTTSGRFTTLCRRLMSRLVIASSKRLVATKLRLTLDTVQFVLEEDELKAVLVDRLNEKLQFGENIAPSSTKWHCCIGAKAAWARLHADIGDSMLAAVEWHNFSPLVIFQIFMLNTPVGLLYTHDIFMSCKMRMWFHLIDEVGSFVVAAIFFSASGAVKSKRKGLSPSFDPACGGDDDEEGFAYKMGTSLAVAVGSVLIASLPVTLLESFHTRSIRTLEFRGPDWKKQLKIWRVQDTFIWAFGAWYMLVGTAFVALLFANIDESDQEKWVITAIMTIVWGEIVLPFALGTALPLVAEVAFLFTGFCSRGTRASMKRVAEKHLLTHSNLMLPQMSI